MYYMANCSATCSSACADDADTNCAVACCNSTNCLDSAFASLMMMMTSTVAPTTPAPVTVPQTMASGNKCHQGTCTGATCYTSFSVRQTCSSMQYHCQLLKETVNADTRWTAGCAANCSQETPCRAATTPPCHLECCNAGTMSCLWLNGTLNHMSVGVAGPTASPLCLVLALVALYFRFDFV
ncbi:uncharacterized protein LOC144199543 [Stigmatopora nigra]